MPLYREAAQRFAEVGADASLGKAHNNAGVCLYLLGRIDEAALEWREAIRAAEVTGEILEQVILLNNLGFMYLERGAFAQAERAFEDGVRRAGHADAAQIRCTVLGNRGEVRLGQAASTRRAPTSRPPSRWPMPSARAATWSRTSAAWSSWRCARATSTARSRPGARPCSRRRRWASPPNRPSCIACSGWPPRARAAWATRAAS
ncbi:MAG: tetratricopeptide repeat protein [Myxococcota bacterium]